MDVSIHVDGKLDAKGTYTKTPMTNTSPLFIANDANGNDEFFKGSIDDVRIYNRALSPDEIADLVGKRLRKSGH